MKALMATFLVVLLAVGCATTGPRAPTDVPPSAPPIATSTTTPTVLSPTPAPTLDSPTPSVTPAVTPPDGDDIETPPVAVLTLADGSTHDAVIGSFTYRETYSDVPYLPTAASLTPVELASADDALLVTLPNNAEFAAWTARYADRDDHEAETVWPLGGSGSQGRDQALTEAEIDAPPRGEWLVEVNLTFPDDEGNANYYWLVAVP